MIFGTRPLLDVDTDCLTQICGFLSIRDAHRLLGTCKTFRAKFKSLPLEQRPALRMCMRLVSPGDVIRVVNSGVFRVAAASVDFKHYHGSSDLRNLLYNSPLLELTAKFECNKLWFALVERNERLQTLTIEYSMIKYIDGIGNLRRLQSLTLDTTDVESIEPLADHPCLTDLVLARTCSLANDTQIKLTGLDRIPHLQTLKLHKKPARGQSLQRYQRQQLWLYDFHYIRDCKQLRCLHIPISAGDGVHLLTACPKLEDLVLLPGRAVSVLCASTFCASAPSSSACGRGFCQL